MKTLDNFLNEYLRLRRAFGYRLDRQEKYLKQFLHFLHKEKSTVVSSHLALKWASNSGKSTQMNTAKKLGHVRQFTSYVSTEDPRHEIPPKELVPYPKRNRKGVYIYTTQEISSLMEATKTVFLSQMKVQTYYILIGLLATTGMRIGEIINLDLKDFKLKEGYFLVRKSKDGQSRKVLLHQSTIEKIKIYLELRNQLPKASSALLASTKGTRIIHMNVHTSFDRVLKATGLYNRTPKPRIHDLRHTFIVRTVEKWYREGLNVESKLSHLSTYVGHISPSSTYWYLHSVPELMAYAAERLNKRMGELL